MIFQRGLDKVILVPNWGVQVQSQQVGVEFSPIDIAGMTLWLKADEGTWQDSVGGTPAVNDGDVVGVWQDFSGNANHHTQGTTASKPLLKLNVKNGMPGLYFDGSDDYLTGSNVTAYTVCAAVRCQSTPLYMGLWGHSSLDKSIRRHIDDNYSHGGVTADFAPRANYRINGVDTSYIASGNWHVLNCIGYGQVTWPSRISGVVGYPRYWRDYVLEIMIYNSILSLANRQALEGYVNKRYALY
jgi:hypothetical protein